MVSDPLEIAALVEHGASLVLPSVLNLVLADWAGVGLPPLLILLHAKKSCWGVPVEAEGTGAGLDRGMTRKGRCCSHSVATSSAWLMQDRKGAGTHLWCEQLTILACTSPGVMPASSLFCTSMLVECAGDLCNVCERRRRGGE